MAKEFITKDNLNTLFSKAAPTRADVLQGGGDINSVRAW